MKKTILFLFCLFLSTVSLGIAQTKKVPFGAVNYSLPMECIDATGHSNCEKYSFFIPQGTPAMYFTPEMYALMMTGELIVLETRQGEYKLTDWNEHYLTLPSGEKVKVTLQPHSYGDWRIFTIDSISIGKDFIKRAPAEIRNKVFSLWGIAH